ncbi:MAG: acetoacetate decarboxylase family protein [Thermodesulfobacteriota bacterium]
MSSFFNDASPEKTVTHGEATFDLPVLYHRDDAFALYFTADYKKVKAVMPSDKLHPVVLPGGKAIVAFCAFNYIETSIGPYGEIAFALPAVFGKPITPAKGLLAAMMESKYPGFGVVVMHLPVTRVEARDAGRGEWGYTKFIADMHFSITPEHMQCRMLEGDEHILDMRVIRKGVYLRDKKPLTTYSVKDNDLIKTVIPQQATKRIALMPGGSYVKLGNHPMAVSIHELGLSVRPLMSVYYPERPAILPSGTIIEKGVRPLDGYLGKDRKADHTVEYPA